MDLHWDILVGYWPLFVSGAWMTLKLSAVAMTFGLALGIFFGLISSSADAPRPRSAASRT